MEHVAVDDLENRVQPAAVMKSLTKPLGTTDLAINYYELEPGDSFAFAYHNHGVQEEVFYVFEGVAMFDTEEGVVSVGPQEAVRFDRGEFQRGWNRGEAVVRALALGAPLEYGEMTKLRYCPACDAETHNELERRDPSEATEGQIPDDVAGHRLEDTGDASAAGEDIVIAVCAECGETTGTWTKGSTPGTVD